jgi:Ran GTPase-activating protein (RanGAP) involved in mRNA processing and transport
MHCLLTSDDVEKLLQSLEYSIPFPNLCDLRLHNATLKTRHIEQLSRIVGKCPNLEVLQLRSCLDTPKIDVLLRTILTPSSHLRALLLDDNALTDASIDALAALLQHNNKVRVLDLSMNLLTRASGTRFGELLAHNKALIVALDLSTNELADAGMVSERRQVNVDDGGSSG